MAHFGSLQQVEEEYTRPSAPPGGRLTRSKGHPRVYNILRHERAEEVMRLYRGLDRGNPTAVRAFLARMNEFAEESARFVRPRAASSYSDAGSSVVLIEQRGHESVDGGWAEDADTMTRHSSPVVGQKRLGSNEVWGDNSAQIRADYTHELVNVLRKRGVEARGSVFAAPMDDLFVFGARGVTQTVSTVCRVPRVHDGVAMVAFTTGDFMLNDNFDVEPGRTLRVENCTFGAAKLLIELAEVKRFISQPGGEEGIRVDWKTLRPLIRPVIYDQYLQQPHSLEARQHFMFELMLQEMYAMDDAAMELARKKGWPTGTDPVVDLCHARVKDRDATKQWLMGLWDQDGPQLAVEMVYNKYSALRLAVLAPGEDGSLPPLLRADPRIAKLAVGRKVLFPFNEIWNCLLYTSPSPRD